MSEDPWDQLQRECNQKSNEQTGTGVTAPGGQPQQPLARMQTQQPGPSLAAQSMPDQQSGPPHQGVPLQQSYLGAPGTSGQAAGAPYMPLSAESAQSMWQQPPPAPDAWLKGGHGQGTALNQAEAEARAASFMLQLIDESPPQVRLVFMILEQRFGVNRAYIGMGRLSPLRVFRHTFLVCF